MLQNANHILSIWHLENGIKRGREWRIENDLYITLISKARGELKHSTNSC